MTGKGHPKASGGGCSCSISQPRCRVQERVHFVKILQAELSKYMHFSRCKRSYMKFINLKDFHYV